MAASLNLEDWSDKRMERAETNLLAGIEFYDRKQPMQHKGVLGHEIPSVEELTGLSMDHRAPKRGKSAKADDLPVKLRVHLTTFARTIVKPSQNLPLWR